MMTLEFYRDDVGAPRAQGEHDALLAQFLESDIQDDPITCSELLARIERHQHQTHRKRALEFIGNSFTLSFDTDKVDISCHEDHDDTITTVNLETVKQALQDWQDFIG